MGTGKLTDKIVLAKGSHAIQNLDQKHNTKHLKSNPPQTKNPTNCRHIYFLLDMCFFYPFLLPMASMYLDTLIPSKIDYSCRKIYHTWIRDGLCWNAHRVLFNSGKLPSMDRPS